MKLVIAPDKFKGTLTATEFCKSAVQGLSECTPGTNVVSLPLSDGGDGFCDVMHFYGGLKWHYAQVLDPLFRPVQVSYLTSKDQTAFIEMARSSGLILLSEKERAVMNTTSFGLGQTINASIKRGARHIIIGLGGSATNDAGIGMASALGYKFVDQEGNSIQPIGGQLHKIRTILEPNERIDDNIQFTVLTDVDNPLYGPNGAAFQYARQKGASDEEVIILDKGLIHFAELLTETFGVALNKPGDGAAGGLGIACRVFLKANMQSGADFVLKRANFKEIIKDADLVLTGEGRFDQQSLMGKLPGKVLSYCREANIPIGLIAGTIAPEVNIDQYFFKVIELVQLAGGLDKARKSPKEYVREATKQIISSYNQIVWTS